ncbi:GspE/PulE family protein [Clostridium tyrobutyricum]|jgi:type IV pilus assembly protein PilB|uniref:Type IV fimbrial assembly, ATPase PilB n=2 Tax=Clostridium tyrobutyricum TaxID=1519 RepID=W6N2G1_CLOTY|nr:GspE/PulE family protein [Clostridium tyrobutyricum]AND85227.1 general secretion pathway protein E [Clostridium tyrobutyricum]MEA5008413.1 GspE/PulE family protein [Clostridium tyrobutyricum]CDL89980.1 Type IV fimbrial assembly, ATPase PilB [Clostridium tyrobutyricum DIVETGP]
MFLECKETENLDLPNIKFDTKLIGMIPEEIARENCVLVFKKFEDKVYAAVDKIPDFQVVEKLKFILKKNIVFFKAKRKYILRLIERYYCKERIKYVNQNYEFIDRNRQKEYEVEVSDSPVVKTANHIIDRAIEDRASDIHIEPFQYSINVRFRIDGVIYEYIKMPNKIYPLICTRIKIMSDLDIAERRIPQDGNIKYTKDGKDYNIRVSTIPTIYGEKFVLRILYKGSNMKQLSKLGFLENDIIKIQNMINYPNGILLVIGPTGVGKTTTLYSLMDNFNRYEKNIVTIEDPVEYTMDGINQINVNNKINFGFANVLRSVLRQDPDIIMIGEIRDEETANIAIRAAITGHLVLSTLHTNDSHEVILRLENMGIPSYLIKDSLIGVISQRLVRKLCPHCMKKSNEDSKSEIIYESNGCEKCNYTGYMGRTVTYEINFIKNNDKDTCSIKENSINLVKRGITTYAEIDKLNL